MVLGTVKGERQTSVLEGPRLHFRRDSSSSFGHENAHGGQRRIRNAASHLTVTMTSDDLVGHPIHTRLVQIEGEKNYLILAIVVVEN